VSPTLMWAGLFPAMVTCGEPVESVVEGVEDEGLSGAPAVPCPDGDAVRFAAASRPSRRPPITQN
jgi:hypothetical protein